MKQGISLFFGIALLVGCPIWTPANTASKKTYRVARGDSLWEIAKKHGITVEDLQENNPGLNPKKLVVGKRLIIPKPSAEKQESEKPTKTSEKKASSGKTQPVAKKEPAEKAQSASAKEKSPPDEKRQPEREEPSTLELLPNSLTSKVSASKISLVYPLKNAYRISSDFGYREDPFNGSKRFHAGIDLAAPAGTPVYAMQDGKALVSLPFGGYGYLVVLEHEGGWMSLYGHLSRVTYLPGERVKRGDFIGEVGSTGRATGSHLHLEVRRNGTPIDPMDYVPFPKLVRRQ